jgi:hypothetical protein
MTLGIDVSRIFSEMIMASNTKDLVHTPPYDTLATPLQHPCDNLVTPL